MTDTTGDSDQILSAAQRSLSAQRAGGTHRLGPGTSIGKGSAQAKLKHWLKRGAYLVVTLVGLMIATGAFWAVFGPIGFAGVMALALATLVAIGLFAFGPSPKPPKRDELKLGSPQQMVTKTELWLESQRAALPPPAVQVVDQLGTQLDALGLQLETIDAAHPAMNEVRELVGEYIPETIDNYRKIPEHLRSEKHTGKSADERVTHSLSKLSGEIDRVTRQLAEGAMDDLAIKDRYLEYRYGGADALENKSES